MSSGTEPDLSDVDGQDFAPITGSPCVEAGGTFAPQTAGHVPNNQYLSHRRASSLPDDGSRDIGAIEKSLIFGDGLENGGADRWLSTP